MKKNYTQKVVQGLLALLLFVASFQASAQLQVTNTANPSSPFNPITLISNVFIGQGVTIHGITYEGTPAQVGFFQNGSAAVGINNGIIISSGNAETAQNTNLSGSATTSFNTTNTTSPLNTIATAAVNDISQYTIVFTPTSSTLSFNYVFGSEEYPEWVGSTFNDVFGFFISGPNNSLPYTNIARVPNTTIPVSINNVNAGSNAIYYNSNTANLHEYDGYTTVMTATATVIPCQQYTMIIAVSDVGDHSFDSGVFLQSSSFSSDGIIATPLTTSPDTVLVEGCASGSLEFSLPGVTGSPVPIIYTVGGTATMGVDYANIPASGVIPAGGITFSIPIVPLQDGVQDGFEYIEFIFNTNPCTLDTVRIYIKDNELVTDIDDAFICTGSSVTLDATSSIPIPPPYAYNTTTPLNTIDLQAVQSTINITGFPFPVITAGMIESICLDITSLAPGFLNIYLIAPDGSFLELSTGNGGIGTGFGTPCFTPVATTPINSVIGPFSGNYSPEGFWTFLNGAPVNGTWTLQVTSTFAGVPGVINGWSINFAPIYDIQYAWSPQTNINPTSGPIVTVSPPTTTDYVVTLTDTYGCVVSDTATIVVGNQLPAPIITCGTLTNTTIQFLWQGIPGVTNYEVRVNGGAWQPANGTLSHTVTGLLPLTNVTIQVRAISPPNATCTLPPLIGTQTCTTVSCALTSSVTATADPTCNGGSNGSLTVTAPTGLPPYSFALNGGTPQNNGTFTGLAAGTYTVIVTDDVNCQETQIITLNDPLAITLAFANVSTACNGSADGSSTVTATNGTAAYTYQWNAAANNQTNSTATNLAAGIYNVTVTDANGCTANSNTTVVEPPLITFSSASANISCNGGSNGSITLTNTTAGVVSVEYSIDGGTTWQGNGFFTGLSIGTYQPIVRFTSGLCAVTAANIILTEPTVVVPAATSTDATCNGSGDGTATASATGGTLPYTYLWNANANNQTTATAIGLNQGMYSVTITDANGCTATITATVSVPSPIILTMTQTDLTCLGATDGTATIAAAGGAGGFSYVWNTTPAQTTTTATNLPQGNYIVTVTDANNCFDTAHVSITGQGVLGITFSTTDVSCNAGNNGAIQATVTGGNGNLNYDWNTTPAQTTATASNLTAGLYVLTVTDALGCYGMDSTSITEPTALQSFTSSTPLDCYNDNSGTATIFVTGGTPNYTYQWNAAANNQTNSIATNLAAGNYSVTTTDANNCTVINTVTVTQPDSLNLLMSGLDVDCNGSATGSVAVSVTGGTAAYSFLWNNNATTDTVFNLTVGTYTVTVTDANGCFKNATVTITEPPLVSFATATTNVTCFNANDGSIIFTNNTLNGVALEYSIDGGTTFQINPTFNNLAAANYTPVARFLNGTCAVIGNGLVLTQPDAIAIVTNGTNISCNGATDGSATATATGGTGLLTYAWSNGGSTPTINNLLAGTYTLTVTDANNCTATASVTITQPTAVTSNISGTNVLCNNGNSGTATVTATGGTGTLSYLWSNGGTTASVTNLIAGNYFCTITDANGCFVVNNITLTEPTALVSSTSTTNITCFGANNGTATATPTGGTAPYTFLWDANANNQTTATAIALGSGSFTVTVTDANGCNTTNTVTITQPTQIVTNVTSTNATCNGLNDGTATVTATGGVGGYTYLWNTTPPQTTASVTNLLQGSYTVTVTDADGCTATNSVTITEPTLIALTISMTSVSCSGSTDGTATVAASGGNGNYTYLWNTTPAQTTATATNLTTGSYSVTVTDANGCTNVGSTQVTTPNPLLVTLAATNVDCNGAATGGITSSVTGGVPNYQYAWNNGLTTASISNVPAGTYTLTVTDANNCSLIETATITQPAQPLAMTTSKTNVSCFGGRNGTATATVTGGTPSYTYLWNSTPAQNTATATGLPIGTYSVVVTDANGCTVTQTVTIAQPAAITLLTSEQQTSCFGASDGTASVSASGGTPFGANGYNYVWNTIPQQTTQTAVSLVGGQTYTVTVTDALGCTAAQSVTISQPNQITLTTTQTNVTCNGFTDAEATVTASGGTPAFSYQWDASANNQTTATATALGVGVYTVTVTDFNNCTAATNVTIIEPNPLFINTQQTNVDCNGAATGAATAVFSGGTPPYYPVWEGFGGASSIENVTAGTYYLTLTDANNCQIVDSVTITEPAQALNATISVINNICNGGRKGEARIAGTGGTFPYQYSLDGTNYSNSNRFVGLVAGNYTIYTKDDNGCTVSETVTVTEPNPFSVEADPDLNIIYGNPATLNVTATGGIAPISYTWTPANVLNCDTCVTTIADSLQFDTFFEVFAVDSNGCEATSSMYVRITKPRYVFVGNAFTPNNDGNNDILYVQGGIGTNRVEQFQVFDRWGELVFEVTDAPLNDDTFGWNGTYKDQPLNGGVFVWVVSVRFDDDAVITYKGSTMIIR